MNLNIHQMPKILLHEHLDGSLRIERVEEIYKRNKWMLPWESHGEEWFFNQANSKSLPKYLDTFAITLRCMQSKQDLYNITKDAIEDLSKDNVKYAELRFCPYLSTSVLKEEQVIETILDCMNDNNKKNNIETRLILCAMRNKNVKHSDKIVELANAYKKQGVVGIDLAGPEQGYPVATHQKAFKKALDLNINTTIHAGEVCGIDSIKEAIELGYAKRIGHGIKIIESLGHSGELSKSMWDILEQNIVLEVCPTSNVQTGAVDNFKEHPLKSLIYLNLPVTINTDNRLVSKTTLSNELEIVSNEFKLSIEDILRLQKTAISGIFDDSQKLNLYKLLKEFEYENSNNLQSSGTNQSFRN